MKRLVESFWVQAIALLATRAYTYYRVPFLNEDAHITMRYARNLAEGNGLVYNLGERVMGFSSPLWTAWCSVGFMLGLDPVVFTRCSNLGLEILALWAFRKLLGSSCWIFGWMFALWSFYPGVSASGIEMPLVVCLVAVATLNKSWWALGLLALSRPEGLVMAAVIGIWATPRSRALALAALVPPVAALTWYYGSPIPHSVSAKAATYGIHWLSGSQWWLWLADYWPLPGEPALMNMVLPIIVLGAVCARPRGHRVLPAIAAMSCVWIAYIATGTPYFWWYMAFPITCLMLLASLGLSRATAYALILASLVILPAGLRLYAGRMAAEQRMAQVTEAILKAATPSATVMAEPIGVLGFQSRLRIFDTVGLVCKNPPRHPGWLSDLISTHHPDYIVLRGQQLDMKAFDGGTTELHSINDLATYQKFFWLRQDPAATSPRPNDLIVLSAPRTAPDSRATAPPAPRTSAPLPPRTRTDTP